MKKLLLLALSTLACSSFAQWSQPWTSPLPAWESTRTSSFYGNSCMDDFDIFGSVFGSSTPVTAINWWGAVSGNDMLKRNFYIAIHPDVGGQPDLNYFVWWSSVKLKNAVPQGVDCNGKKIYKFFADIKSLNLPDGHYWIQISEDDAVSSNPGQPDFWWSSRQPVQLNNAIQLDFFASISQLTTDPFNGQPDDLAFEIL